MSFEHVPKFVWHPIAVLLWAFVGLVVILTFMSARAKWFEIDFLNLAIKVENVDQQISITQQKISTTMGIVDDITKQLNQLQSSIQSVSTKSTNKSEPISSQPMPSENSYGISQPVMQQLQMQKNQLEGISGELRHVQDNLQSSVLRKNAQ